MSDERETRLSKRFLLAAVAYAALLFAISQVPGDALSRLGFNIWDKAAHVGAYVPLGAAVMGWLLFRRSREGRFSLIGRAFIAIAVAIAYGLADELHQSFVPGRTPSYGDVVADFLGASIGAIGLMVAFILSFKRRSATPSSTEEEAVRSPDRCCAETGSARTAGDAEARIGG